MDNRKEARDLAEKITQIKIELQEKHSEIEQLRKDNARLIERNLGKSRKSPALRLGREKIASVDNEIAELTLVKDGLQKRLDNTNAVIRQEQIKNKIVQFNQASKDQLVLLENVRRGIKALENSISALEASSSKNHVLYKVLNLCWDYPDAKSEMNIDAILKSWSPVNTTIDAGFDSLVKRLDYLRVDTTNFWNQLGSLRENKRSYHRVELRKPINQKIGDIQDVRRLLAKQDRKEYEEMLKRQPKRSYVNS